MTEADPSGWNAVPFFARNDQALAGIDGVRRRKVVAPGNGERVDLVSPAQAVQRFVLLDDVDADVARQRWVRGNARCRRGASNAAATGASAGAVEHFAGAA